MTGTGFVSANIQSGEDLHLPFCFWSCLLAAAAGQQPADQGLPFASAGGHRKGTDQPLAETACCGFSLLQPPSCLHRSYGLGNGVFLSLHSGLRADCYSACPVWP